MPVLDIKIFPDSFLRKTIKPIKQIDEKIKILIDDMAETMYHFEGVGLAAIQVGIDKSIIVYDDSEDKEQRAKHEFKSLINPELIEKKGQITSKKEGCLSVPDLRADVKRAEFVRVKGLNINGGAVEIEANGLLSNILQHEIDHLNGVLFIDKISTLKRSIYKRKIMKKHKKNSSERK
jgi:peptide deformylase